MSFVKALLVILFISCSAFLFSQTTVYNINNSSLPNNAVRCLAVDTNNIVWIGTDYGLAGFDGSTWQLFNPLNSPLSDYYIRSIEIDSLNRLWIGTLDKGIFIYDGSSWTNISKSNSGIPDNSIREVQFGVIPGTYWVATGDGLGYFDGTGWTIWNAVNSGFFTNNISSIAITPGNEKRIGTLNGGLHTLDSSNTSLTLYTSYNSGLPDNTTYKVELDDNGNLWMATPSAGLLVHLGGNNWQWFTSDNMTFPTNSTNYVLISNDLVYVSTYDKGLVIMDGANYSEYNMNNAGFPENYLKCIAIDKTGVIWLGTDAEGLIRLDRSLNVNESVQEKLSIRPTLLTCENNIITVNGANKKISFELIDLSGKTIEEGKGRYKQIILNTELNGIYFLRIKSGEEQSVFKIAINR